MVQNLLIGGLLIIVTTSVHSLVSKGILQFIKAHSGSHKKFWLPRGYWIFIMVLLMIFASIAESLIWASAYLILDVIQGFEDAVYFSLVTYTTLGYGDITLDESYRLLASIEAANGIIIFGWSTAVVMAVVQRIYFKSATQN